MPASQSVASHSPPDFRRACQERGLTVADNEYNKAMEEAATLKSGRQLRQLLAHILLWCEVEDPAALDEAHYDALSDFGKTLFASDEDIRNAVLLDIDDVLQRFGHDLDLGDQGDRPILYLYHCLFVSPDLSLALSSVQLG